MVVDEAPPQREQKIFKGALLLPEVGLAKYEVAARVDILNAVVHQGRAVLHGHIVGRGKMGER